MFKAKVNDEIWMVQQHHHAQVSGFLAAHWGGRNGFAHPGDYPGATQPDRWRDEVVLGIAQHDNGWWETEAMPRINPRDALPVGVGEASSPTQENEFAAWNSGGFDRWRNGIQRLAGPHPYGALLISLHAYWLYAVNFPDLVSADLDLRRHFVFGAPDVAAGLVGDEAKTRAFLEEQSDVQAELKFRISQDAVMAKAVEPEHLAPHFRLLQLLDSMSLYLALNDVDEHELNHLPRSSWSDRCTITWRRVAARTIALDPYPFAVDQLVVSMPARVIPARQKHGPISEGSPMTKLHATSLQTIDFTFTKG